MKVSQTVNPENLGTIAHMSSSVHEPRINQVGKLILNHYRYIIVGYLDAIRWAP